MPGNFAYHAPTTVEEAVGLLADLGEEARPLAGGHSLIPMMKLRLAPLEHLVDLRRIAALKGIREEGAALVIGAMTTQAELLARSEEHTSELQSLMRISYAVFCLKKKKDQHTQKIIYRTLSKKSKT